MNSVSKIHVPSEAEDAAILARLGTKPTTCWLPKSALCVDKAYQREISSPSSKRLITKLKNNFCWAWCAPLVVVPNGDETYAIIDGQHRWAAAKQLKPVVLLPCHVLDAITVAERAKAFVAHNEHRQKVGPLALFHARAVAGDVAAMGVRKACQDAGVVIPRGHRKAIQCKPNETSAIGVLEEIFNSFDPLVAAESLTEILKIIREAYPERSGQISSFMVRAVWSAVDANTDASTILAALKTTHDADLRMEASFAVAADPALKQRDAYAAALRAKIAKVSA